MHAGQFDVPILYIIFNRLETVEKTFPRIAELKPTTLYISADGPRENIDGEKEKCENVRNWVLSHIDWNCNVHTMFSDKNLGCKYGPAKAIKWFFSEVDFGIVNEDDILQELSCFYFYKTMLEKYKNDSRVGAVCGFNFIGISDYIDDIFMCSCFVPWGWASWKRVIDNYDPDFAAVNLQNKRAIKTICQSKRNSRVMLKLAKKSAINEISAWDFPMCAFCSVKGFYSIFPKKNFVRNVGFIANSTHTAIRPSWYKDVSYDWNNDLVIPENIKINTDFSKKVENWVFIQNYGSFFSRCVKAPLKKLLIYLNIYKG